MRSFCCFLWLLGGWQLVWAQPLTPAQIFAKTTETYHSAASYQDVGEVVTHNKSKDRHFYELEDYSTRKPFETAFIRETGQFRFRYQDIKPKKSEVASVIWSDGKRVKTWNGLVRRDKEDVSLRSALRTVAGISFSSSVRVPGLLLDFDAPSWNLNNIKKLVLTPQMVVAGKTCYHLRGTFDRVPYGILAKSPVPMKEPTESHPTIDVWIDTTTFLLIRISETYNRGKESFEHTITFQPRLNEPVKSESLVFYPRSFQVKPTPFSQLQALIQVAAPKM